MIVWFQIWNFWSPAMITLPELGLNRLRFPASGCQQPRNAPDAEIPLCD
jgi:hypothetical protein